jgi:hypothetical protein
MTFFSNYDYTAPNEKVISEQLIGKDLEIRDHGLTQVTILAFTCSD